MGPARVVVRAPATSANMGPGFDTLGIAVGLYDEFAFTVLGSGPSRAVTYDEGSPATDGGRAAARPAVPTDGTNLAIRAFKAFYTDVGLRAPEVEVTCRSRIPVGRGLGSSAAAITAGITAAEAMLGCGGDVDADGDDATDAATGLQRRLDLAARIEGHPDNTSACILGGMVASAQVASSVLWARVPLGARLNGVVAIPETVLSTKIARNVLPSNVPHSDAVFNVGRVALLVASMVSGDLRNLHWATEDRLHQPYRASLAPGMASAMRLAVEAGALGAYVSGAGPSVMALVAEGRQSGAVAEAMGTAFAQSRMECTIMNLPMGAPGAGVLRGQR